MQIDMQRFHAVFFEEAAEHLASMEQGLLLLEKQPQDAETLHTIFRAAHSIKGASGTFGFAGIAQFTHDLESLLDGLRDGRVRSSGELVDLLLRSADALSLLVAAARDDAPPPAVDELARDLKRAQGREPPAGEEAQRSEAAPAAEAPAEYAIGFRPAPDLLNFGMDPLLILRDLAGLGNFDEVSVDTSGLPSLEDLSPEQCHLSWTLRLRTARPEEEIRGVFVFVQDNSEVSVELRPEAAGPGEIAAAPGLAAEPAARPQPAGGSSARCREAEASTIRVSVKKVDDLLNLVGELVISQSMVNQAMGQIPPEAATTLTEALTIMQRSTRELQEQVMSVRMVPLANVFRRFPRLVRDLATAMGKRVRVEISGEDTELDKQMIEQIGDPLTHLVRNAVDHGIATPDERRRAGKAEEGVLGLKAYHEGGNVVIEVSDDGRGLDSERIRRKAVALGLAGEGESLSESEIHHLIFAPGLSTAETVSDVSGRGVGMDVVKRNIEAVNGSVRIVSHSGRGTTFQIRLPLTMAILDGLAVALGGEVLILPILAVVRSFQPLAGQIRFIPGNGEVVLVHGEVIPLVRVHRVLNLPASALDPTQGLVVIVENQGRKLGLLVDELVGQIQVVMKSLEANYQRVEGLSGATILGDGTVAYILDVAGLDLLAKRQPAGRPVSCQPADWPADVNLDPSPGESAPGADLASPAGAARPETENFE